MGNHNGKHTNFSRKELPYVLGLLLKVLQVMLQVSFEKPHPLRKSGYYYLKMVDGTHDRDAIC